MPSLELLTFRHGGKTLPSPAASHLSAAPPRWHTCLSSIGSGWGAKGGGNPDFCCRGEPVIGSGLHRCTRPCAPILFIERSTTMLSPSDKLVICFAHVAYRLHERFSALNNGINSFAGADPETWA